MDRAFRKLKKVFPIICAVLIMGVITFCILASVDKNKNDEEPVVVEFIAEEPKKTKEPSSPKIQLEEVEKEVNLQDDVILGDVVDKNPEILDEIINKLYEQLD